VTGAASQAFVNVAWPDDESEDGEEHKEDEVDEGDPRPRDILTDEMIKKVSDVGYPISQDGLDKFQWKSEEQEKRDQDIHDVYIYNDFSGYGVTEMMDNFVRQHHFLIVLGQYGSLGKTASSAG
jgi:hypothetical protein